jgi:hypothetical protein
METSTWGKSRTTKGMAKVPTHGPMDASTSGNTTMGINGMESLTVPMELSEELIPTVNGLPNNQPDIAEKAERFTVLVGCWEKECHLC